MGRGTGKGKGEGTGKREGGWAFVSGGGGGFDTALWLDPLRKIRDQLTDPTKSC